MKVEPVKIHLRKDAKLYCVATARWVPFSLLSKIKTELEGLEGECIIEKSPRLVHVN